MVKKQVAYKESFAQFRVVQLSAKTNRVQREPIVARIIPDEEHCQLSGGYFELVCSLLRLELDLEIK